jgi:parallel beta-helix repeat protein
MKIPNLVGATMCAFFLASGISLFAQGPLTPPGPPAPTMKSLDQIEPRTPISAIPYTISQPGSYIVTGSLTLPAGDNGANGITIAADNVTIDLGGFTLDGNGKIGANGITISTSHHAIKIRNGNAQNWSQVGFDLGNSFSTVLENLEARNNATGILVGAGQVSHCIAAFNTSTGFSVSFSNVTDCGADSNPVGFSLTGSTLRGSRASNSSDRGIDSWNSSVDGCMLQWNHWGIVAGNSNIHHNTIFGCNSDGIRADNNGRCIIADNEISGCGTSVSASGIWVTTPGNRITNNNIIETNGDGIGVAAGFNMIDSNTCIGNSVWGIHIFSASNTIVRNNTLGNGGTYNIVPGNDVGPAQPAATATNPWSDLQIP